MARPLTAAAIVLTVIACSPPHHDASTDTLVSVNQPRDEFKLYSTSSMVEVQKFDNLPDGLKVILERGKYSGGALCYRQRPDMRKSDISPYISIFG
jgi:hypothetical protein